MKKHSVLMIIAAVAATIAAGLQFAEGDRLRGANALVLAALLALMASGAPERSRPARWAVYLLLALAFVLLGSRLIG